MRYRTMENSTYVRLRRDRRSLEQLNEFPLEDLNGNMVFSDRRTTIDRRTEGLDVTEAKISQAEFQEYLSEYQRGE